MYPIACERTSEGIRRELQRLLDLVGLRSGGINVEVRLDSEKRIHFMELAPRSGGNMLSQLMTHALGFDVVKNTVEIALGHQCDLPVATEMRGCYAYYVLHSHRSGILRRLEIPASIQEYVIDSFIWSKPGDRVERFTQSNCYLGVLILRFETRQKMNAIIKQMDELVAVETDLESTNG